MALQVKRANQENGVMKRSRFIGLVAGASGYTAASALMARAASAAAVSTELMATIRMGDASAPGFIAKMDDKSYVITCTTLLLGHNRLQCETVHGRPLKPLKLELSLNRDIARIHIDVSEGLETASSVEEGDTVSVLVYSARHGRMEAIRGKVAELEEERFFIDALDAPQSSGRPVLSSNGGVYGVARMHESYRMQDDAWEPRTVQTAYMLEGDEWISPPWKKYNRRFGAVLHEADGFRHDLYALARVWLENPVGKLALDETMSNQVKDWAKQHNGMVNRCVNARRNAGKKDDPYHGIRNTFRENCRELGNIAKSKADSLKFLADDRYITPFMKDELMWRFYELYVFAEYVWRQRKKAAGIT